MYLPVGKASRCPGGHQKQRTRLLYFTGDPTRAAPTDSDVDDSRRTKKGQCLTGKIKYLKLGNCENKFLSFLFPSFLRKQESRVFMNEKAKTLDPRLKMSGMTGGGKCQG